MITNMLQVILPRTGSFNQLLFLSCKLKVHSDPVLFLYGKHPINSSRLEVVSSAMV
jgi:hypothetical protein